MIWGESPIFAQTVERLIVAQAIITKWLAEKLDLLGGRVGVRRAAHRLWASLYVAVPGWQQKIKICSIITPRK